MVDNSKRARTDISESSPCPNEELVQTAQAVCLKLMSANDASHDYSHALRVAATAHELALQEPGCDVLVCRLAAILHDVVDHKYCSSEQEADAVLGGALARLIEKGLSPARASQVKVVIENVSFSKELKNMEATSGSIDCPLELAVVQDADKLDAIGAIGIARTFTFGGARKRPMYNPDNELVTNVVELSGAEYATKAAAPTYDHFYEKLLRLKGMMKTKSGSERARQRHAFMEAFLQEFRDEVSGRA